MPRAPMEGINGMFGNAPTRAEILADQRENVGEYKDAIRDADRKLASGKLMEWQAKLVEKARGTLMYHVSSFEHAVNIGDIAGAQRISGLMRQARTTIHSLGD